MKKCPFCAEEIQDEAIMCRYCGRDLVSIPIPIPIPAPVAIPQLPVKSQKKKVSVWLALAIIVLLFGLCVMIASLGNSLGKITPTQTVVHVGQVSRTNVPIAVATNTPRPLPTSTSLPKLGLDLSQFVDKYDSLTDIQKKDFINQSTGKWVNWSGEIFDVKNDGTIEVNIPGTLLSLVNLNGVSQADAIKLSKGQMIHFTGQITSVTNFVGLYIDLGDVKQVGEATALNSEAIIDPVSTAIPVSIQTNKIGDPVQIGNLTMTVNSFVFSNGNENWQPDTGKRFAIVDVTFENKGTKSENISSMLQMSLKDNTGQEYSEDMGSDISSGSKQPGGEIVAGDKLRGKVGYQVPIDAKGFRFTFDASLFSAGKVFVDLGQ